MKDMYGIDCKPHLAMPQRGGAPCPNGFGANAPTGAMHNAPTGQTVIAQGNALGTNVPPKPPSPNGANVRVNHVAPLGQMIFGGGHTQGVALGYHSLCRWHIDQNDVTPIAMTQFTKIQSNTWPPDANQPLDNAPPHDEQTRKDQSHDDPTFKSPTQHAPIRNARTRNAPTGQTVIAQGNALGTNVPPKPPSPNGANVRINHVAPLGQMIIGGGYTQGDALGYHSLCRWHIGQNKLDQGMKYQSQLRISHFRRAAGRVLRSWW